MTVSVFRVTVIQTGKDYGYWTAPDALSAIALVHAQFGNPAPGEFDMGGGSVRDYKEIGLVAGQITPMALTDMQKIMTLGYNRSVVQNGDLVTMNIMGAVRYLRQVATDTDGTALFDQHQFAVELQSAHDEAVDMVANKGEVKRGYGFS